MPGAFNGNRERALVFSAIPRYTARKDLPAFGYITVAVFTDLLIIDHVYFIGAEGAYAFFPAAASFLNHINLPLLFRTVNHPRRWYRQ